MQKITCSFSGHRIISAPEKLSAALSEMIKKLSDFGYIWFQSGGALGFDLLAAEAVIALREGGLPVKLRMVLPCRDQSDRWTAAQKEHYNNILSRADEVVCLNESFADGCMHERNRHMAETSSVIIAYMKTAASGTGYTVKFAESIGVKIINLADL